MVGESLFVCAGGGAEELFEGGIGDEGSLQEGVIWIVGMSKRSKCPVLCLFKGREIVLGVSDDVFRCLIHQVFVVLVSSIASLWDVFCGLQ